MAGGGISGEGDALATRRRAVLEHTRSWTWGRTIEGIDEVICPIPVARAEDIVGNALRPPSTRPGSGETTSWNYRTCSYLRTLSQTVEEGQGDQEFAHAVDIIASRPEGALGATRVGSRVIVQKSSGIEFTHDADAILGRARIGLDNVFGLYVHALEFDVIIDVAKGNLAHIPLSIERVAVSFADRSDPPETFTIPCTCTCMNPRALERSAEGGAEGEGEESSSATLRYRVECARAFFPSESSQIELIVPSQNNCDGIDPFARAPASMTVHWLNQWRWFVFNGCYCTSLLLGF